MTYTLTFTHLNDSYEVLIRGTLICRITKYLGNSQLPRQLTFDECNEEVQEIIMSKIQVDDDD